MAAATYGQPLLTYSYINHLAVISHDSEVVNNWCATEAADQHNNKAVCHSSCVAGQQLWAGQPADAHFSSN